MIMVRKWHLPNYLVLENLVLKSREISNQLLQSILTKDHFITRNISLPIVTMSFFHNYSFIKSSSMIILVALRKQSGSFTPSMFWNKEDIANNFIQNNQGFLFTNHIKGIPAYWKRFQMEVLVMI